ncbi:transcriptional regulator NrdR [Alienimonas chondri]|uniref:Transcriptional repressor NrdR n=1 Tax=Alienimonas chondri TaxID=2681879 RepID=A0ABX1VHD0_9PLAN|nr:transcriptional regulator NrdR [Alienimonas chondri]NNJ26657.1 Transcriptional repressor NrdR [Alienimonas chondri]
MICPFCRDNDTKVIDSRPSGAEAIRRRRECLGCGKRFTTYEKVETAPLKVLKRDHSTEPFDREKARAGVIMACRKRPVTLAQIDELIAELEADLLEEYDRGEVPSRFIGDQILEALKRLDEVAAVRFASVLHGFEDVREFSRGLELMRRSR